MKALSYLFVSSMIVGCVGADGDLSDSADEGSSALANNLVSSISEGDFVIRSVNSGKCLDVASSSKDNGAKVQQWDCNGSSAQSFHLTSLGGNVYEIVNVNSGKALDISGVSNAAGALLNQWDYVGGANQKFQIDNQGGTAFSIKAQHSGLVLDVPSSSKDSGTQIQQWPSNGTAAQRWTFDKIGGGSTGGTGTVDAACTPQIVYQNLDASGDGALFDQKVPDVKAFAQAATRKVCSILYRSGSEVRSVPTVKLVIEAMDGVAYTAGDETHVSSRYLRSVANSGADLGAEIKGVVHHEFTHIYQYNDGPGWLIEGVADFVRFRSGLIPLSNRHKGGHYDDAYQTTAFFLAWLDDHYAGFGYKINQSLSSKDSTGWSTNVFKDLTGKDVDTLWNEYQSSI